MGRVYLGNFDFDSRLGQPQLNLPRHLQRLNAELSYSWLLATDADDVVLADACDDPLLAEGLLASGLSWPRFEPAVEVAAEQDDFELAPWGWDAHAVRSLSALHSRKPGKQLGHPPLEVVQVANSRQFSVGIEHELECGVGARVATAWNELPGLVEQVVQSRQCHSGEHSIDSLDSSGRGFSAQTPLVQRPESVVFRANWSNSGRALRVVQSESISDADRKWVKNRLLAGPVVVEPWLEMVERVATLWQIVSENQVDAVGTVRQFHRSSFGYAGGLVLQDSEAVIGSAVHTAIEACLSRLAADGYRGPVGIDSVAYRDHGGAVRWRALQDVNVRYSLGRLICEAARRVARGRPSQHVAWISDRWNWGPEPQTQWDRAVGELPQTVEATRTAPFVLAGEPVRMGGILFHSDDPEAVEVAVRKWLRGRE